MRILFINTLYPPTIMGGAQRTVQEIAEGMAQRGHAVRVLALADNESHTYEQNGVEVEKVKLRNVYHPYVNRPPGIVGAFGRLAWHLIDSRNIAMRREVDRSIEAFVPDVVSTHCLAGFSTAAWEAIERRKLPLVHVMHDYYLICARSAMYSLMTNHPCETPCGNCRVLRSRVKRQSRAVSAAVGVSEFVINTHERLGYFPMADVKTYVHNSYDRRTRIRRRTSHQPFRFGYLGSILPEKGVEVLLSEFSELDGKVAKLLIFGGGRAEYVEKLRRTWTHEGISWMGEAPTEVALDAVDALVVPSTWHEPFGRVVIEALAAGIPVVGAARGGISEILTVTPAGFLFDPDVQGQLRMALETLAAVSRKEYSKLSAAAVTRSRDFANLNTLDRYEQLLSAAYIWGKRVRLGARRRPIIARE